MDLPLSKWEESVAIRAIAADCNIRCDTRHTNLTAQEKIVAKPRTPVAVALEERDNVVVLCDDGTVWEYEGSTWVRLGPPIPGSSADVSGEGD